MSDCDVRLGIWVDRPDGSGTSTYMEVVCNLGEHAGECKYIDHRTGMIVKRSYVPHSPTVVDGRGCVVVPEEINHG